MRHSDSHSSEAISSMLTLACAATALTGSQASGEIIVDNSWNGTTVSIAAMNSVSLNLPGGATISLLAENYQNWFYEIVATAGGTAKFGLQDGARSMVDVPGLNVAFRTGANSAVTWDNNGGARAGQANLLNVIRSEFVPGFWRSTYVPGATTRRFVGSFTTTYGYKYKSYTTYTLPGASVPVSYEAPSGIVNGPGSFTDKFMLFTFEDGGTKYGWVEMLSGNSTPGTPGAMAITLGRVAYDTSGAALAAGIAPIPEPASTAAAMGGAMVLGAAGIRRWRRERAGAN